MVHNVEFSCSHISFVWLHGLNSLQWWLLTCPDLANVVWFQNNIDWHEYPKQLQAPPAKKRWNTRYPKYPMILEKNRVRIGYCQKLSGRVGYRVPVRHCLRYRHSEFLWRTRTERRRNWVSWKFDTASNSCWLYLTGFVVDSRPTWWSLLSIFCSLLFNIIFTTQTTEKDI